MVGPIPPQLCRTCHGHQTVEATCACGCGEKKTVTCTACGGTGMERGPMLSWLSKQATAVPNWLASKFGG